MGTIKNIMIGNVGPTAAQVVGKIPYSYGTSGAKAMVYSLVWDAGGYDTGSTTNSKAMYANNVLIEGGTATDDQFAGFGQLFIGSDYDQTGFGKMHLAEIQVFDRAFPDTMRTNFERYLASKWLPNGDSFNGWTITPGVAYPTQNGQSFFTVDASDNSRMTVDGLGNVTGLSLGRRVAFNDARTPSRYNLTQRNRVATSSGSAATLARTRATMQPNTGKYYFETVLITSPGSSVHIFGISDVGVAPGADFRPTGWSISNTGALWARSATPVVWNASATWGLNDVAGLLLDTDTGQLDAYKNGVLLGTVLPAGTVTTAVEVMCGSAAAGYAFESRFNQSEWTNAPAVAGIKGLTLPERTGTPELSSPKLVSNFFKGSKPSIYFDGTNQNFKCIADNTADGKPYAFTMFVVVYFDGITDNNEQVILKTDSGGEFRLKRYAGENVVSAKFGDSTVGNWFVDIPDTNFKTTGFVPSDLGNVRVKYGKKPDLSDGLFTPVKTANSGSNGATKHDIVGLTAGTNYYGQFEINGVIDVDSKFTFKTFLSGAHTMRIACGSCNRTASTSTVWAEMAKEKPDLLVHLGDLHYSDVNSSNKYDYYQAFDVAMGTPEMTAFFKAIPTAYIYDNHDALGPNPNVNFPNWPTAINAYLENFPGYVRGSATPSADGSYFAFTIGRVRCIVTDMRRMRNPIQDPDGPSKTTLGANQKAWLKAQLLAAKNDTSIAHTIWFCPICYIADADNPDGDSYFSPGMSWANYATERKEIANYIFDNSIRNVLVVCADTHMQAMDDGRNSVYATDGTGARRNWKAIPAEMLIPVVEASPFDQYLDYEGGPWQINDNYYSGGPRPSYEESYTILDIVDKGQNWINITMTQKYRNPDTGVWGILRKYSFNRPASGTPGTPPPIDNGGPWFNGYEERNGTLYKVNKRYVGNLNAWQPQRYKWVGNNGYWNLVYSDAIIDTNKIMYLTGLDGYTANPLNYLQVKGFGFTDVMNPVPKAFAYYFFNDRLTDGFGNFSALQMFDASTPTYETVGGFRSIKLTGGKGIQSEIISGTGFDFNGVSGAGGYKTHTIGVQVWFPSLTATKQWIFFTGNSSKFRGVYKDVDNKFVYVVQNAPGDAVSVKSSAVATAGAWISVIIQYLDNDATKCRLIINGVTSGVLSATKQTPVTTNTPVYLGMGYDSASPTYTTANFRDWRIANIYENDANIERLAHRINPSIVFKRKSDGVLTTVPSQWILSFKNDVITVTVPPTITQGAYTVYVEHLDLKSVELPIDVVPFQSRKTPINEDFKNVEKFKQTWYAMQKAWGGANGGVVAANVYIENGVLVCESHGELYDGPVQGVDRDGNPKFNGDGSPWVKFVGGCLTSRDYLGYGSYRVVMKVPPEIGVATALWTFHYEEIYPGDPRYSDFQAEGLHQQGTIEDGFYMTRNHEIDIELPSHLDGGDIENPSLQNCKCNTWRGELKDWAVPPTDPAYWEEYRDNLTPIGFSVADGYFHEYRIDWHNNRVEFYIDGVLKQTNVNTSKGATIPDIPGHFVVGQWFPRGGVKWAGKFANWSVQKLYVQSITWTPFDEPGERQIAETYAFGGVVPAGGGEGTA